MVTWWRSSRRWPNDSGEAIRRNYRKPIDAARCWAGPWVPAEHAADVPEYSQRRTMVNGVYALPFSFGVEPGDTPY
jgi:hypothetical protein